MNGRRGGRGARRAGRYVRPVGVASLLLLLAGGAGARDWPEIASAPLPYEAVLERIDPGALAAHDSLEASLLSLLWYEPIPEPPQEPAGELLAWLIHLLTFADADLLDRFAASYDPDAWTLADPDGQLPLPLALALQETGRPREALGWLERGRRNGEEEAYRKLLEIELRASIGDSSGAERAARQLRLLLPGDQITLPAVRLLLRRHEEAGRTDRLLAESLEIRRTLGPGAEEMAARLRALQALGRFEEARPLADSLITRHPWTRTARVEALRRLEEEGEEVLRAEGAFLFPVLLHHRLFTEAEAILEALPASLDLRLDYLERLLAVRRYDAVLARTDPPGEGSRVEDRARWLLVHARAARNSLRFETMERYYRAAAGLGGATRTTALWEWGREAESEQRELEADSIYTVLMEIPGQREEARYRRALARFAAGRFAEASADLEPLDRGIGNGGAAFWRARVAGVLGDTAAARLALQEAAEGEGYYGSRARAEIAFQRAGGTPERFWQRERARAFTPSGVGKNEAILACEGSARFRARAGRIRLFRRFARAGWVERERRLLESELPVSRRAERFLCLDLPDLAVRVAIGTGSQAPELRYPRPFGPLIEAEAERAGIAAGLVWAIARRESLFDPGAVSSARAIGLLQLVETTARATARRWGIAPGPLARVDRNVPLGILHLRDLLEQHDWPLPGLLAAYNAGAAKAAEWVERFPDPDLFIERIGWRETRSYVRHVLDGWWKYRSAYRIGEGLPQDPVRPEPGRRGPRR